MYKIIIFFSFLTLSLAHASFAIKPFIGKINNTTDVPNHELKIKVIIDCSYGILDIKDCGTVFKTVDIKDNGEFYIPKLKNSGSGFWAMYHFDYQLIHGDKNYQGNYNDSCSNMNRKRTQKCKLDILKNILKNLEFIQLDAFVINPTISTGEDIRDIVDQVNFKLTVTGKYQTYNIFTKLIKTSDFPYYQETQNLLISSMETQSWISTIDARDYGLKIKNTGVENFNHNYLVGGMPQELTDPIFSLTK